MTAPELGRAARLASEIKRDTLTGIARALADEAVLIVERLEQLDRQMQGDAEAWLGIQRQLGSDVAEVRINAPLAEARQQATALKGLLVELARAIGQEPAVPVVSKLDDLADKREKRLREGGASGVL